jgi:hypothetical protein
MARMICEACISIDVRDWARRGLLKRLGLVFPLSWTRGGELYDHAFRSRPNGFCDVVFSVAICGKDRMD